MKKCLILMVFTLSLLLTGCSLFQSYNDIYQSYETHLEEQSHIYLERITLLNNITEEQILGVVSIKKVSSTLTTNAFGSGFIFDEDPFYYYILTNNHIVADDNVRRAIYTVYDYKNNAYAATYIASSNLYDLGVLRIRKRTEELRVFEFAKTDPLVGTDLITVGFPENQMNTILLGSVLLYGQVNVKVSDAIINISFDVIYARIPVKSGSSGSVVMNNQYEIVGIVFAGDIPEDDHEAEMAYIIPISQIKIYLTQNALTYREVKS